MRIHSFIKFQIVLGVLFTHGLGEGQDVPIANILCTNSSGWRDAIRSCLSNGGRPLSHEEILTTHISDKNVFPVWTADYDVLSNTTDETSEYQPGRSMCGYATITILSFLSNFTKFNVTAVNYGNCAEMRPYVCEKEVTLPSKIDGKQINVSLLEINMGEMTWMDAKTHCNSTERLLVRKSWLNKYTQVAYVNREVAESVKLEVWIGSIGILDSRTVQSQIETVKMVKHGIFSYADGFRTTVVNQSNEFRALCGFESVKHVNETTFTDCLPGKESTNIHFADSLQSDILCTSVSSWSDAMDTCLNEGGRPLTYDDIKMTNLSDKIDLTVWTAEYTTISNQRWNSSIGRDLLRDTVCGIQTIHIDKLPHGSVIEEVTDFKYKNCTEQQAYVCDKEQHMHPRVYLNKATWMNAETSCKSQNRRLLTVNQLDLGNHISVVPELSESTNLDVWIGLLASLDFRIKTEKGPLRSDNIVKYGTFSNSAGFRMNDGNLHDQFSALCGFESLMSVHKSLFTECLEDVNENLPKDISTSIGVDVTKNLPKDISTSSEDSLSNAATAVISIATTAVVIGSIVIVFHVLYFYRKRHNRKEAKSLTGQITSPSKARVLWSRQDNTADEVGKHNETEKEANYEIPDNIQPVHVNGRVEDHREAFAMVNHESVYVNKTSEAHHEVSPDNIQHVYVNQTEESRYQPLIHVKESVYVNKTPEGHYEKLVNDNTESIYVNE